jgi:transcription antitermination factor NusG
MKPGDKVKIVKGPYKGMRGILRGRINATDTNTKSPEPC